tara:strand:+ start:823 stop:1449 length:627 start_codon:yes stop_codon:yes gene_type:complete
MKGMKRLAVVVASMAMSACSITPEPVEPEKEVFSMEKSVADFEALNKSIKPVEEGEGSYFEKTGVIRLSFLVCEDKKCARATIGTVPEKAVTVVDKYDFDVEDIDAETDPHAALYDEVTIKLEPYDVNYGLDEDPEKAELYGTKNNVVSVKYSYIRAGKTIGGGVLDSEMSGDFHLEENTLTTVQKSRTYSGDETINEQAFYLYWANQ